MSRPIRLLRGFLLYWLILWLPLQSAVVLAMPLCGMAVPAPAAAQDHPCHQDMSAQSLHQVNKDAVSHAASVTGSHAAAQAATTDDPACEHCSPCRVISAGFMPGVPPVAATGVSHHVQHAAPARHMARIYLPLEHRPPISA